MLSNYTASLSHKAVAGAPTLSSACLKQIEDLAT